MKYILNILIIFLLIFSGCSRPNDTSVEKDGNINLTFWHTMNREETATLDKLIKKFEENSPKVKIIAQEVPFDQAQNKYKTVAQAGLAPDIFRSEIAWTTEEAALGLLVCLDEYLTKEEINDYLKIPLNYNYYEGKLWGIPQVTDCLALLYNKRFFKELNLKVPETMDDFIICAQKLTKDENGFTPHDGPKFNPQKVVQYGFYFPVKEYWFQVFVWAFGGDLLDVPNKKILINSEGAIKGFDFLLSLRDKYRCLPAQVDIPNSYSNMMAGFKEGKFAMIFNGPWASTDIMMGSEFKDPNNLGVAVIPKGPGGYGSPVGGHNYVISRSCKHIQEAVNFIKFMNLPENQKEFAINNNLLPTRKSAYVLIKDNILIDGFRKQLEHAKNRPVIPQSSLLYTEFKPNFEAGYLGKLTPKEALDNVARAWKWMLGW